MQVENNIKNEKRKEIDDIKCRTGGINLTKLKKKKDLNNSTIGKQMNNI